MFIYGKIIGGALGFLVAGPFGAIIGLLAGHFFDKGVSSIGEGGVANAAASAEIQQAFFNSIFTMLGFIAKADGRVSEEEVAQTEQLFNQLGLDAERRKAAIELFKQGSADDFILESVMIDFARKLDRAPELKAVFLTYLIVMALADGHLDEAERQVLLQVAHSLQLTPEQFKQILDETIAQTQFHSSSGSSQPGQQSSASQLKQAYQVLGVDESMTPQQIKKAYRRLMSENHPDKLIAKGVPDDMMKIATEKAQDIQAAFELIKQHHKNSH